MEEKEFDGELFQLLKHSIISDLITKEVLQAKSITKMYERYRQFVETCKKNYITKSSKVLDLPVSPLLALTPDDAAKKYVEEYAVGLHELLNYPSITFLIGQEILTTQSIKEFYTLRDWNKDSIIRFCDFLYRNNLAYTLIENKNLTVGSLESKYRALGEQKVIEYINELRKNLKEETSEVCAEVDDHRVPPEEQHNVSLQSSSALKSSRAASVQGKQSKQAQAKVVKSSVTINKSTFYTNKPPSSSGLKKSVPPKIRSKQY